MDLPTTNLVNAHEEEVTNDTLYRASFTRAAFGFKNGSKLRRSKVDAITRVDAWRQQCIKLFLSDQWCLCFLILLTTVTVKLAVVVLP